MRQAVLITILWVFFTGLSGYASAGKLPVIEGKIAVATVNDDPITLAEFNRAIAASHANRSEGKKAGRIDYSAIIKRLVNARLIVLEAGNIGLDQLPEIRVLVNKYSEETLMELLLEQYVKDITVDEEEVQRAYEESVKEWKITSVRFEKEDAAKKFEEGIQAGKSFDEMVRRAVEVAAVEVEEGRYLKGTDLLPVIAQTVSKMDIGSVSPIFSLGKRGFVIFRLENSRLPEDEDPEARKKAQEEALIRKKTLAARNYYRDLKEKYVKLNEDLVESLDYEAEEPGFEKLLQDNRVIAEIVGEKPLTVGDLGKALKEKFHHGIERAIERKRVNKIKRQKLEDMLQTRVLTKEALKQNLDKTEEYTYRIKEYENSLIFGAFVQKVITPDIKLNEKELKNHYRKNSEEFMFPEMIRIKSLVFRARSDAVNTLNKLNKGTDFNWLSVYAEGQEDKNSDEILKFEGALLTVGNLPAEVRKAVSGAEQGEYRLYASPKGYYYVLYIYDLIPAKPQPFEDAKKEIAEKVFSEKVKKAVEDYAEKLRDYYPVKIYAKELQ